MNTYQHGALIVIAVGGLLAGACKKDEPKPSQQPTMTTSGKPSTATPPAGSMAPGEKTAKVHCTGINECSGQGACKTAKNDCADKNSCKGQGFIDVTEQECKDKGCGCDECGHVSLPAGYVV